MHVSHSAIHVHGTFALGVEIHAGAIRTRRQHSPILLSTLTEGSRVQIGVLNWFAKLWEIEAEDMWGYVTNCGTEGNLHGILTARENLPDGALATDSDGVP